MKVKFANGTVKSCAAPTEQKLFKTTDGVTLGAGWILILRLTGSITSTELDALLTSENVGALEFLSDGSDGSDGGDGGDGSDGGAQTLFTLNGYEKVTSSTIRHSENAENTYAEIQISRGI